jgi:AcrR family transcriptional regulator
VQVAQLPGNVRQRQAVETHQHLLSAACEVFEERGYQATSVGAITSRANTAHGTFYLYFKNKEDAFCQVMEAVIIDELGAPPPPPDPAATRRERLEVIIRGFFANYEPHLKLWRAVLEASLVSERVQTIWLQLRRVLVDRVIAGLREGQAFGAIRPLDPEMSGHALASMVDWFTFLHLGLNEPPMEDRGLEPAIEALVDLWYHAVFGQVSD